MTPQPAGRPHGWFPLGVALLMSFGLLTGCASPSPTGSTPAAPSASVPGADTPGTRIVTDMAGREVTVPAEVKSIGTFGSVGVLNAFVQLMGHGDKIVNQVPANFTRTDQWKMQYSFSPQIADGPLFEEAGEVVMENVLQAAPDVSFTMTKQTATLLEEKGVAAVYLDWNNVNDVKKAVTLVGEVLGADEAAERYLAYFDAQQAKAAGLLADLPESERTTVLYGDPVQFRQPHVIAEWWITQAGGASAPTTGAPTTRSSTPWKTCCSGTRRS